MSRETRGAGTRRACHPRGRSRQTAAVLVAVLAAAVAGAAAATGAGAEETKETEKMDETKAKEASGDDVPAVGSVHTRGQTQYVVVGASRDEPFEYVATGESLEIIVGDIPGTIVLVPEPGTKVRIDPSVPMAWVDGKEREPFTSSYVRQHGKGKLHLLLELDRDRDGKPHSPG